MISRWPLAAIFGVMLLAFSPSLSLLGSFADAQVAPCPNDASQIAPGPDGWEAIAAPRFPSGPQELTAYAVDLYEPRHMFVTNGRVIMASTDGGCTFRSSFDLATSGGGLSSTSSVVSLEVGSTAETHDRLYAVVGGLNDVLAPQVFSSPDSGRSWDSPAEGLPPAGTPVELVVSDGDPDKLYLALNISSARVSVNQQDISPAKASIYRSVDAGATWSEVTDASAFVPPTGVISDIAVDPLLSSSLWATTSAGLVHSSDGGASWTVSPGPEGALGALDVTHIGGADPRIVAFSSGEPEGYWSVDGGRSWELRKVPASSPVESAAQDKSDLLISLRSARAAKVYRWEGSRWDDLTWPSLGRPPFRAVSTDRMTSSSVYAYTPSALWRQRRFIPQAPQPPGPSPAPSPLAPAGRCQAVAPDKQSAERDRTRTRLHPADVTLELAPGTTRTVPYELTVRGPLLPVDVFFLVDTTNSMEPGLCGIRRGLSQISTGLVDRAIDPHFGVAHYTVHTSDPIEVLAAGEGPYVLDHNLAPPNDALMNALNRINIYGGGPESQLTALYQAVTGEGETSVGTGPGVPPGQNASFRPQAQKIIVHATDEYFGGYEGAGAASQPNPEGPSFEEVIAALKDGGVHHIGLALGPFQGSSATPASSLDPWGHIRDLRRVSVGTGTLAPQQGVDCDADGVADIRAGDPIVCQIEYQNSQDARTGIANAIIHTVLGLVDPVQLELVEVSESGVVSSITPDVYPRFDLLTGNVVPFDVNYRCMPQHLGKEIEVTLEARVNGVGVGTSLATISCGVAGMAQHLPEQTAARLAPIGPPPVQPAPVPHPKPHPQPQPRLETQAQPNPQQQPQANAQPAAVTQRQEQPQVAFVHAAQQLQNQLESEHAMVRLRHGRNHPLDAARFWLATGAVSMILFYGLASVTVKHAFVRRG